MEQEETVEALDEGLACLADPCAAVDKGIVQLQGTAEVQTVVQPSLAEKVVEIPQATSFEKVVPVSQEQVVQREVQMQAMPLHEFVPEVRTEGDESADVGNGCRVKVGKDTGENSSSCEKAVAARGGKSKIGRGKGIGCAKLAVSSSSTTPLQGAGVRGHRQSSADIDESDAEPDDLDAVALAAADDEVESSICQTKLTDGIDGGAAVENSVRAKVAAEKDATRIVAAVGHQTEVKVHESFSAQGGAPATTGKLLHRKAGEGKKQPTEIPFAKFARFGAPSQELQEQANLLFPAEAARRAAMHAGASPHEVFFGAAKDGLAR